LTAILQSEKLILPRSGEALTLRVSPRGFLKASTGGRPSGRPYPYTITRMRAAFCQTLQTGQPEALAIVVDFHETATAL